MDAFPGPQPDPSCEPFVALPVELLQYVADGKVSVKAAWVYVLLLGCINRKRGDTKVWPSRRWLAQRMRMGQVRAIDRYIDELRDAGLLSCDRRRDGKVNDTNMYTLHLVRLGGSALQSTTVRPAKTRETAGEGVVRPSALGSALQSTRGSAPQSTGVVRCRAPELEEVELEEVEPDERTISLSGSDRDALSAPVEADERERDEEEDFQEEELSPANAPARRLIAEHCGITDELLAEQIIGYVESGNNVRTAGFWVVAARNGTIHGLVTEARDAIAAAPQADGWKLQSPADHGFAQGMALAQKYDRLDGTGGAWFNAATGRMETRDPFQPSNHRGRHQPYRDPDDLSVYDQPL